LRWKTVAATGGEQGEREARSILRRTTSTWVPAGSDADRKPEIEEKRRSETKAIIADRGGGQSGQESERESRRCRRKCKILPLLLPVGNSDERFFSIAAIVATLIMKNYIWKMILYLQKDL